MTYDEAIEMLRSIVRHDYATTGNAAIDCLSEEVRHLQYELHEANEAGRTAMRRVSELEKQLALAIASNLNHIPISDGLVRAAAEELSAENKRLQAELESYKSEDEGWTEQWRRTALRHKERLDAIVELTRYDFEADGATTEDVLEAIREEARK